MAGHTRLATTQRYLHDLEALADDAANLQSADARVASSWPSIHVLGRCGTVL